MAPARAHFIFEMSAFGPLSSVGRPRVLASVIRPKMAISSSESLEGRILAFAYCKVKVLINLIIFNS
jgi:hypothetical protein